MTRVILARALVQHQTEVVGTTRFVRSARFHQIILACFPKGWDGLGDVVDHDREAIDVVVFGNESKWVHIEDIACELDTRLDAPVAKQN